MQHQQPVRILLVSQMYPGPDAPDLGVFVRDLEQALEARGHTIDRAVLDTRAGGKRRYLDLYRQARAAAGAAEPDVVYAHFLVPSGLAASLASRAPLVVTAHGRDVRNIGELPGVAAATRRVVRRAARVIAVSDYLRRELEAKLPDARGKVDVVDSGVDLERFRPTPAPDGRARLPLRRLADRAQERPPARRRVRAPRPRHAHLRRRRAAARAARAPRRRRPPRPA